MNISTSNYIKKIKVLEEERKNTTVFLTMNK